MGSDAKKLLTILSIIIIFPLLLAGVLLSTSCILFVQSNSTYTPKVISDGTGGAIAVYEEVKSGNERNFYAQRINSGGKSLWGDREHLSVIAKVNLIASLFSIL